MRLLLDSHTLLWSLYEPETLPSRVEDLVADLSNQSLISHVTVLELANKATALRLPLVGPSPERLLARVAELGATLLPITLSDILAASKLPRHHADPLDRILIAQAQANGLVLVTKDSKILEYDVRTVWR